MRLDIEADGSLSAITLPAGYAHGQIRQAAALTPDEAVSLWEQGTYLHMYPPAYMEEPPRERARVLRVRLEYWEQADQAVRLPGLYPVRGGRGARGRVPLRPCRPCPPPTRTGTT